MLVTDQEIHKINDFVSQLNSMKESTVVVEGKRDAAALRKIEFLGRILEFHRFGGMVNFTDSAAGYERLIILFDRDRKGRVLTRRTIQLLQRRTKVDLSFKKKLRTITKGKVTFIEQLACYESCLV